MKPNINEDQIAVINCCVGFSACNVCLNCISQKLLSIPMVEKTLQKNLYVAKSGFKWANKTVSKTVLMYTNTIQLLGDVVIDLGSPLLYTAVPRPKAFAFVLFSSSVFLSEVEALLLLLALLLSSSKWRLMNSSMSSSLPPRGSSW